MATLRVFSADVKHAQDFHQVATHTIENNVIFVNNKFSRQRHQTRTAKHRESFEVGDFLERLK